MSDLNIELCPETGICSIIKQDGSKVDLMPGEVTQIRDASGSTDAVKQTLAEVDSSFADGLDSEEVAQVAKRLS